MIEHVWLIADAATGDVSYVQHGAEGHPENWKTIGPFAYTKRSDAVAAARSARFLPRGVTGRFEPMEVEAAAFIQAIFNGFPPTNTDVFLLDEKMFPLTSAGADWIDDHLNVLVWSPLFDEDGQDNGLSWLDRVLQQVAHMLQMSMETVLAIGSVNAATEDDRQQAMGLIQKHVKIIVTPEAGAFTLKQTKEHHVLSPSSSFWLHTVGLTHFDLPELEIRHVPALYIAAASALLQETAADALDQGLVAGDEFVQGTAVKFRLRVLQSPDLFWIMRCVECLRIEVSQVLCARVEEKETWEKPVILH